MRSGGQNFPAIEFAGKKSPDLAFSNVDRYGFTLCLNLDPKDAPSIYVPHGSVLFLSGLKSKQKLLSNSAFPLWNHKLFTLPTSFSPLPTRTYCLLYRKATWFINSHATATVGMSTVERTSKRLPDRISQHVPKSIRSCSLSQKRLLPAHQCKSSIQPNTQSLAFDSAIGPHCLPNPDCAQHYDDSTFFILAQGHSSFHLSALEATSIKFLTKPAADKGYRVPVRLKDWALMTLSHWSFPANHGLAFSYK